MKNGDILTFFRGPSSAERNGSLSGLPIVNSPPGTATILIAAVVPGTVSVKFANEATTATLSYFSPPPVSITLPSSLLCS